MDVVDLAAALALGTALAACAGVRAFAPLFLLGVAARLGFVDVGDAFAWLAEPAALVALGLGVVGEVLADKVPWVHHVLDVLSTPLRWAAGAVLVAAPIVGLPLWIVAILALVVGGGVAVAVHVARGGLRVASTTATAGAAAPAHSLLEDVVCVAVAVLSIAFALVALVVAVAAVTLLVVVTRAAWRRLG